MENENVDMCISIGSNASISAYDMGFDSRVFYRALNLSNDILSIYDNIFKQAPKNMHINSFKETINYGLHKTPKKSNMVEFNLLIDQLIHKT